MSLEIRELDFVERVLTTNDERRLPIAHLFDAAGRETADHRDAILCIAGRNGEWVSVRLASYRRSGLQ